MDWYNIAERAIWTFAQAALSVAVADGANLISADLWQAAALAGLAAVLSLIKNIAREQLGTP